MQTVESKGKYGVTDGARTRDNQNHNLVCAPKKNSILAKICGIFSGFWPDKNQRLANFDFPIFSRLFARARPFLGHLPPMLALCGCASSSAIYEPSYLCPHFFTEPAWHAAEEQVASVTILRNVSKHCGRRAVACLVGHDVYLTAGPQEMELYVHEVCHAYRVHVMGLPGEAEAAHKGWIAL
jgi:hypothetical protein